MSFEFSRWPSVGRLLHIAATIVVAPVYADDLEALSLAEAERLALVDQPLILTQEAAIRAARAQSIADRELPDPMLVTGVDDLPISGEPAFTLDRDEFTIVKAGIRQEFPRAEKRRLRGERGELEAKARTVELATVEREVRRDAALAWLDVYLGDRSLEIVRALADEYASLTRATEISVRASMGRQADLFAARMEEAGARDRVLQLERDVERARAQLGRLIGTNARRPMPSALPSDVDPAPLDELLETLRHHPQVDQYAARVRVAENDVALANAEYKPDWALSLEYGHRQEFPDFVSVEVEMGLPLFPKHRQNQRMEASLAAVEQMRAAQTDVQRIHEADLRRTYVDWLAARDRLNLLETDTLPSASHRVEASRAAYQSARGSLAEVLSATRDLHETELKQLALHVDLARARTQLHFFAP